MTPAPTLIPDAKPADVIITHLQQDSQTPVDLWKYCVGEWVANYYAFDPENYFLEQGEPVAEEELLDANPDDDVDVDEPADEEDFVDVEPDAEEEPVERVITPEIREQMVLYAPLCNALKEFWNELLVFTTDNPTVPNWEKMCKNMERFIAFMPVDRDRLIRHVRRIDQARQEAQALVPQATGFQSHTLLLDILNNKFD